MSKFNIGDRVEYLGENPLAYLGVVEAVGVIGGLHYLIKFDVGYSLIIEDSHLRKVGKNPYLVNGHNDLHPVPKHYEVEGLEQPTMDIIAALVKHNTTDVIQATQLFSIYKYLFRFGKKDGIKDLIKARDFLHRLIDEVEND